MKFTIGTASSSLDFREDMKLIKSSLLYADDIELIGMAEYAVFKYLPQRINSVKDIETMADSFIPFLNSINVDGAMELAEQLKLIKVQIAPYRSYLSRKKKRSRQEILAQMQSKKVVEKSKAMLIQSLKQITESPLAIEINKLIELSLIHI